MATGFFVLRSTLAAGGVLLAAVTGAVAQSRCEGTLCDLYYDHVAPPQPNPPTGAAQTTPAPAVKPSDSLLGHLFGATPTQPQPPSNAAPAKKPLVAVQGGGLVGLMHGDAPQRCTGTLCDLFYGGPPPEEPAARPAAVSAPGGNQDAAEDGLASEPRPVEREPTPACAAGAGDPWRCYR